MKITHTINVAKDFSQATGGRYRKDGNYSGEAFREDILSPIFDKDIDSLILINFQDTYGCCDSFLEEAFGGLVRKYKRNFTDNFVFHAGSLDERDTVWKFMEEAYVRLEKCD